MEATPTATKGRRNLGFARTMGAALTIDEGMEASADLSEGPCTGAFVSGFVPMDFPFPPTDLTGLAAFDINFEMPNESTTVCAVSSGALIG